MKPIGRNSLSIWWQTVVDWLFPKQCLGCSLEGDWLCPACRLRLKTKNICQCPLCRRRNLTGAVCENCRTKSTLAGLWVVADYDNKLVQKIIQAIKYRFIIDLAGEFDSLIADYFLRFPAWSEDFVLVPIPLARKRFLARGFNQAELICLSVQRNFKNQIEYLLKRDIFLSPQVELDSRRRQENISGNFSLAGQVDNHMLDRRLVLVDDVYTTGATMQECAKVLHGAGFKEIWGLVIARN
ncbi:MAG TPA: hypothetical protein PK619_02980 [bacterium]|nr:hypothetical protein [bacterium]HPN81452.1 hypothetical protein [bacterium]HPW39657.1 hypothetical protein [bacterium]